MTGSAVLLYGPRMQWGLLIFAGVWLTLMASTAEAQPSKKTYRVGWLDSGSVSAPYETAVRQALVGYHQDVTFEYRAANGHAERLGEFATQLARLKVDLVLAVGNDATQAAKQATESIPIVMLCADAVSTGAVSRLEQPGGNITGVTYSSAQLTLAWLKLLKELQPSLSRVAVLYNAGLMSHTELANFALAAAAEGTKVLPRGVPDVDALGALFAGEPAERAEAVMVPGGPFTLLHRQQIIDLASRAKVPTIYGYSEFVDAGGLIAYGPSLPAMFRRAGAYIGRILNNTKPRDLPVEQPSRFELVINLKTAKALGVSMPESLVRRADRTVW